MGISWNILELCVYIYVCDCGSKLWHPSEHPKKLVFRDVHPEGKQMSLSIINIYIYVCVYINIYTYMRTYKYLYIYICIYMCV